MAKPNRILPFILILSFLLFVTVVESKFTIHEGLSPSPSSSSRPSGELSCFKVVGVKNGDTCFDISKTFGLGSDVFSAINPNLNCTALFVGQWLCIDGAFP